MPRFRGGLTMDFIERIFHLSPDAGSGATESGFVVAIFAIVGAIIYWVRLSRTSR
jgi:hypothetical protein